MAEIQGSSSLYKLQQPGSVSGTINVPNRGYTLPKYVGRINDITNSIKNFSTNQGGGKSELDLLREEIDRLTNQLNSEALPQTLDIDNILAQAQKRAIKNETPQFNKEKQIFINRIKQRRNEAQAESEASRQALADQLKNTIQDIETGKTRASEDVARNVGDINTAEQQFQQDEGLLFQEERTQLADATAQAGLTTSGIGRQKQEGAQEQRNVVSARTLDTLEGKREAQEIFKTRTFADYNTAEKREVSANKREKQAVKRQLKRELNKLAYEKVTGTRQLQREFESDVLNERRNQARILIEQAIADIGDPRSRQATRQAYGGYF